MIIGGKTTAPKKENVQILHKESQQFLKLEKEHDLRVVGKNYQGINIPPALDGSAADVFNGICAVFEKDRLVVEGRLYDMLYGLSLAEFVHESKIIAPRPREFLFAGIEKLVELKFFKYTDKIGNILSNSTDNPNVDVWLGYTPKFLSYLRYTPVGRFSLQI